MARRCIPDNALRPLFPVTVVQHEEFNSSGTLDTVDNIFVPCCARNNIQPCILPRLLSHERAMMLLLVPIVHRVSVLSFANPPYSLTCVFTLSAHNTLAHSIAPQFPHNEQYYIFTGEGYVSWLTVKHFTERLDVIGTVWSVTFLRR